MNSSMGPLKETQNDRNQTKPKYEQVKREVGFQKDMLSLLGAMDGVVCAAGEGRLSLGR